MHGSAVDRRRPSSQIEVDAVRYGVHVVRGREPILRMRDMLIELSVRCGQPGTMEDLGYFLSKPGLLKRIPQLYLIVKQQNLRTHEITIDDLMGALLLYEYHLLGFGMGAFATNDRSGRGTMLALPLHRLKVAAIASRVLLDRGAQMVMLSFRPGGEEDDQEDINSFHLPPSFSRKGRWASRTREISAYLPLQDTYDATLAKIGQKTRSNMRYYRRRAETQLGCTLISDVQIDREEYLTFNRECMFPVPDQVASWRYKTQKTLTEPVLMGMKDKDGRWLAILGGRRHQDRMEILWQMNRNGMTTHSFSTVMRSYCIEHEVARQTKRLYIEGGTAHSLHHSFVKEELIDLIAVRRSPVARLMQRLAEKNISPDNDLANMLKNKDMVWLPC